MSNLKISKNIVKMINGYGQSDKIMWSKWQKEDLIMVKNNIRHEFNYIEVVSEMTGFIII